MKRPQEHITDTAARKLLQTAIPNEWVAREQADDYGIDYEVEVFSNQQSTGVIFKVQLKGMSAPTIAGDCISYSLELKHTNYYLNELAIPVFIVIADTSSSQTYWYAPQIDDDLANRLRVAMEKNQETITVHVPLANTMATTTGKIIQACVKCILVLATKRVSDSSEWDFSEALKGINLTESFAQGLQDKADMAKLNLAYTRLLAKEFPECIALTDRILQSADTNIETKFQALLYQEDASVKLELRGPRDSGEVLSKVPLFFAQKMLQLSVAGPLQLRTFARAADRIGRFHVLVMEEYSLFLNLKIQPQDPDPFILIQLSQHRAIKIRQIRTLYRQSWRMIHFSIDQGFISLIPQLVQRLVPGLNIMFVRLRNDGLRNSYLSLRRDALLLIQMAFELAVSAKDFDTSSHLALDALLMLDPADSTDFEPALRTIISWTDKIPDVQQKQSLNARVEDSARRMRENYVQAQNATEIPIEEEENVYRRMATSLGIDLENPDDRIAQIVNIGLRDLNPERVLRNCRHFFLALTGGGVPAQMLQLPTAGGKALHCLAKHITIQGLSLDSLYEHFKASYCAGCELSDPHPAEWKWTRKWQLDQNSHHLSKLGQRYGT